VSLFAHILKHVKKDRPGLPPEGLMLPGAESWSGSSPFLAGSADHLAVYGGGIKVGEKAAEAAVTLIVEAARELGATREPSDELILKMEMALDREEPLAIVDAAIERVLALELTDWEPLYDALSAIALNTVRPRALKTAMGLLGAFQEEETIPFFATMARHPEFSLFATTALANDVSPRARAELLTLLEMTQGWAKVDVVERLLRVEELDLADVLLTKSMDGVEPLGGYIAIGVAERCDLAGALSSSDLMRDTLTGACHVLAQLASDAVEGGPLGSLDDYSDAADAIDAFVERLPGGPADLDMAEASLALQRWAAARDAGDVIEATAAYLERPDVIGAMIDAISGKDAAVRDRAAALAGRAGMTDALTTLLEIHRKNPEDDAVIAAAVCLAGGKDLEGLRDRMIVRIRPETRTGDPLAHPWMDAAARHTWQYVALLEALPRLGDPASRGILRTATTDRDPAVRRAAVRSLKSLRSEDPADRAALDAAAKDPSASVAREAPRLKPRKPKAPPEKVREKPGPHRPPKKCAGKKKPR